MPWACSAPGAVGRFDSSAVSLDKQTPSQQVLFFSVWYLRRSSLVVSPSILRSAISPKTNSVFQRAGAGRPGSCGSLRRYDWKEGDTSEPVDVASRASAAPPPSRPVAIATFTWFTPDCAMVRRSRTDSSSASMRASSSSSLTTCRSARSSRPSVAAATTGGDGSPDSGRSSTSV